MSSTGYHRGSARWTTDPRSRCRPSDSTSGVLGMAAWRHGGAVGLSSQPREVIGRVIFRSRLHSQPARFGPRAGFRLLRSVRAALCTQSRSCSIVLFARRDRNGRPLAWVTRDGTSRDAPDRVGTASSSVGVIARLAERDAVGLGLLMRPPKWWELVVDVCTSSFSRTGKVLSRRRSREQSFGRR